MIKRQIVITNGTASFKWKQGKLFTIDECWQEVHAIRMLSMGTVTMCDCN